MVGFGNILKSLRKKAGLTQKQLAEKMGVTASVVSYYELSERTPSPETLIKLANIFHVSTDYLLGIKKNPDEKLDISGLGKNEIDLLQNLIDVLQNQRKEKL